MADRFRALFLFTIAALLQAPVLRGPVLAGVVSQAAAAPEWVNGRVSGGTRGSPRKAWGS